MTWEQQLLYGIAQPLLGLRLMFRTPSLRWAAIVPAIAIALICLVLTWDEHAQGIWAHMLLFWLAFIALAPIPPVVFARHYARMAAETRNLLGLGPRLPYVRRFYQLLEELVRMLLIVAIGVAPITLTLGLLPRPAPMIAVLVSTGWTLLWVVVEALDNARTLEPGRTVEACELEASHGPMPTFLVWSLPSRGALAWLLWPVRMVNEIVVHLARPWRVELGYVERAPWVMVGFGLGTTMLLAVPGINLFFRPAVIIGGAHLLAYFDRPSPRRRETEPMRPISVAQQQSKTPGVDACGTCVGGRQYGDL